MRQQQDYDDRFPSFAIHEMVQKGAHFLQKFPGFLSCLGFISRLWQHSVLGTILIELSKIQILGQNKRRNFSETCSGL